MREMSSFGTVVLLEGKEASYFLCQVLESKVGDRV